MGAPAYISFPHFAHADPSLLDAVVGMEPDEDRHSFTLDIIPVSEIMMTMRSRDDEDKRSLNGGRRGNRNIKKWVDEEAGEEGEVRDRDGGDARGEEDEGK